MALRAKARRSSPAAHSRPRTTRRSRPPTRKIPPAQRKATTRTRSAASIATIRKPCKSASRAPASFWGSPRWRKGKRDRDYDPNVDATRQEMRSFVCGQCHVEYYCGNKETLFYPWNKGLKVEQIEQTYEAHNFPDGTKFYDFEHGETGAHVYK